MTFRLPGGLGRGVSRLDEWLTSYRVLYAIVIIFFLAVIVALFITSLNLNFYLKRELCVSIDCLVNTPKLFRPQMEVVKFGVHTASFVALIFGSYLALRSYLTSSNVGAFGNRIAHIGFFERFMAVELQRRRRLNPERIDIYGIYKLMFPKANANSQVASDEFIKAIEAVHGVVRDTAKVYIGSAVFDFEDHRKRMILALKSLHITMDSHPRIDFLEVEDELLDFLSMLCLVFAPDGREIVCPDRCYR